MVEGEEQLKRSTRRVPGRSREQEQNSGDSTEAQDKRLVFKTKGE